MLKKILALMVFSLFFISVIPNTFATPMEQTNRNAIAQHNQVRTQYLSAKTDYRVAKQDWLTAKNKWQNNKNNLTSDEAILKGKGFLTSASSTMIAHLNFLKSQVENNVNIHDSQNIIAQIDQNIADMENIINPEIETVQTKEELVNVGSDIRIRWDNTKGLIKSTSGFILNAKINDIIERMNEFTNTVDQKAQDLEAEGYNVTDLQTEINDVNQNLVLATQKHESAQTKFQEIGDSENANTLFNEGYDFILEAENYLKTAHSELRNIVVGLRTVINTEKNTHNDDVPKIE